MALCDQADVEQKLQWDITAEPDAVVTQHIADAQALIESFIGRTVESAARSETLDGGRVSLFLTAWPVTAVASVTEDGTGLTVDDDYEFYPNGKLIRVSGGYPIAWQTGKARSIVVTYTGGFVSPAHDRQLEHLGSLCAEVVARAFFRGAKTAVAGDSSALAEIQSVGLDGAGSVTYATASGESFQLSGGVMQWIVLEPDEKNQLYKYQGPPFA